MNSCDTPKHRAQFREADFHRMVANCTTATLALTSVGDDPVSAIYNSINQTMVSTAIWLQEHGAYIPAEICAELEIEVRYA